MVQVTVNVEYLGKNYQTNVIARQEETEELIFQKALAQVKQQWK
ncbi:BA3454 family stress response protein [Peribacillus sp. SCS-155]